MNSNKKFLNSKIPKILKVPKIWKNVSTTPYLVEYFLNKKMQVFNLFCEKIAAKNESEELKKIWKNLEKSGQCLEKGWSLRKEDYPFIFDHQWRNLNNWRKSGKIRKIRIKNRKLDEVPVKKIIMSYLRSTGWPLSSGTSLFRPVV